MHLQGVLVSVELVSQPAERVDDDPRDDSDEHVQEQELVRPVDGPYSVSKGIDGPYWVSRAI